MTRKYNNKNRESKAHFRQMRENLEKDAENRRPKDEGCSPAERARDTSLLCAEAADYVGEIRFEEMLYYEEDDAYLELLWGLDDDLGSVMIVGHNPTTASVIETLSGVFVRMPTAALARIDFTIDEWSELEEGKGQLVWVQLPRQLD